MSTSLYTSRSLNAKIWASLRSYLIIIIACLNLTLSLIITTLKFSGPQKISRLCLGFWEWGFKIFSVLCAPFRALFSSVYFHINFEAITEIVEEPGHPYMTTTDLLKFGFVPNEVKSLWEPVQVITWLGVVLDTTDGTIKATDERIEKLNAGLVELVSCQPPQKVHVKRVATVTGQITSLSPCVGYVARIMTRFLFSVVNSARSWESEVFSQTTLFQKSVSGRTTWYSSIARFVGWSSPSQGHLFRCLQFGFWCFRKELEFSISSELVSCRAYPKFHLKNSKLFASPWKLSRVIFWC